MDIKKINDALFADLHIHSRFSRACSKNIDFENLAKWARIKGLNLLGTGDFTHPVWFNEIKKLREKNGFYYYQDFPFIITGEISLIYTQERGRRIHLVLLVPGIEVAEKINAYFDTKGRRDYDGRPIFKIPGDESVREMMEISKDIEIIPAHVWTPWFGIFGSMSGFDSLKECFKDQVENIHAIETGMSCYDKETEVLTNNGWKSFSDVVPSDFICTLNIDSNKIEYQKSKRIQKSFYGGKMYKLKTKRVDLLVTPNHNMFVSHCDFRKDPFFSLKKAEDIIGKSKRFKKDGIWIGKDEKYFTLPAVKIKHGSKYYSGYRDKKEKKLEIKDWLKFLGFFVAEGWTTKEKIKGRYGVYVCSKDKKIMLEMKKFLNDFGYNTYMRLNREIWVIRVLDFQLYDYLKQFGKCWEKHVPLEIKNLSKELLEIFLKYYIIGDGHIYGRNGKGLSATTTSVRLRDDLQEIALKVGMSAYYKLHNKKGTLFKSPCYNYEKEYYQRNDSWNIYFIRQNLHTVIPSTIKKFGYAEKWVDFKGNVYCVSVPNRIIYIRRNGIPVWCGNSDPKMNWRIKELEDKAIVSFSDAHSFWPFRLGREATIFKKTDSYQEIIRQIRNNDFIATIETDPAYGKYHFDGHRNCNFSCSHEKTKELNGICPVCKKPLTLGVDYRVEKLADNPLGFKAKNQKPFYKLLPLHEIIALAIGKGMQSKNVWNIYNSLIKEFGNEFNILLNISREELLNKNVDNKLIALILKNRKGNIKVKPGYDGVYGEALLGEEQKTLF